MPADFGRRRRARRFTIIEILIAIVVLVLGITGIIALFPTAIESGNQTVEDSYAAAITQSVVDAISVGIREARYVYDSNVDPTSVGDEWTYFIFTHDGVIDPLPPQPELYAAGIQQAASPGGYHPDVRTGATSSSGTPRLYDRDYCILLPRAVQLNATGTGTGTLTTNNDVTNEPFFIYPVPLNAGEADQREAARLDLGNVIDNLAVSRQRPQLDGTPIAWIPRVYPLGRYRDPAGNALGTNLPGAAQPGGVRLEFLGEQVLGEDTIALDPYPNYSYAFAMRRERIDSNENGRLDESGGALDDFSDSLFLLRVYVFKNFDQQAADDLAPGLNPGLAIPRTNVPIRKFVTLISL